MGGLPRFVKIAQNHRRGVVFCRPGAPGCPPPSARQRLMAQSAARNFFRAGLFYVPVTIAFQDVIGSPVEVAGSSMQPEINPHLGPQ